MSVYLCLPAYSGEADITDVRVSCDSARVCRFDVTVSHSDEGWEHYANKWEVLDQDGEVLGTRRLAHPHVSEQPFTRSLSGVRVPADVAAVIVRAYDSVHGAGGIESRVTVP
ncbi:MAG: hypothetical protein AAGC91_14100 [Pseudomonadota bacterium]